MYIQKFIEDNIPNVEARGEFEEYKTLKECLANPKLYDLLRQQTCLRSSYM